MEVEPLSYRIVDIEPPATQLPALQNPTTPAPTQGGSAAAPSPAMIPAQDAPLNHNFAIPAAPTTTRFKNIPTPGMNIFQAAGAENTIEKNNRNLYSGDNVTRNPDPNAKDSALSIRI
jgi:hypothetical protein